MKTMTTDEIIRALLHCAEIDGPTGCYECPMYAETDGAPDCINRLLALAADELTRLSEAAAMVNTGGGVQLGRLDGELTVNVGGGNDVD